ncbi:MAG: PAS domain S-box protein, partial [Chloroflexia bacterium]|nr:PAS domain S-box protein [Chloroflexia bacterium]
MDRTPENVDPRLERARAEAALRESEERYRTLFESIDEGFCVIELLFDAGGAPVDYRFLEVNPAFERHTGLHEATGKSARELVPTLEAHWFEIYGRVATTGEPVRFVLDAQPMDHRWFDVYAFRLGGPDSRKVAILFTDISARKRAESDIERLAAIVESSHDAILRCQPDGIIVDWNRGAEELCGYAAAEIVGRDVALLIPPERNHEWGGTLDRLRQGEDIPSLETVWRRKDGTPVEVEMRSSAVRDASGQVVGIGIIARDVTARKRLERAQEDFLAMASHDLRSPVTVVRGRAQLMRRRKAYDEAAVDVIIEQSWRIERLADDLQEVVRLEAGAIDLRRLPTDLGRLARDAAQRVQPQATTNRVRVVVPDIPVVGHWDEDRLGQILDNLLGNAIKYSATGGEIVVQVTARDGEARLSVADRGEGIPAEAMPRLFERFYR